MSTQFEENRVLNSAELGMLFSASFLEKRLPSLAAFATRELTGEFQVQRAKSLKPLPSVLLRNALIPFPAEFSLGDFADLHGDRGCGDGLL